MEILNSYIIASVQRSGTHLLCTLLRSTGVAGLPAEHFLAKPGETWERRWKSPSRMQYIQRVLKDNTTANGVFGTVVMWSYFDRMLQMLRDIPKYNAPDRRIFSHRFFTDRNMFGFADGIEWSRQSPGQ